jgi:phosphoglycolate phosphatase-like HAD superfamily hydrolase
MCEYSIQPELLIIQIVINDIELSDMKRVIIFDFDGVLAESLVPMLSYAEQVCQELGVSAVPSKADLEALDKMEFSEFGHQLGVPGDQIENFVTRNHQLFSDREEPIPIKPGMKDVITGLADENHLAIITGNSCKLVEKFLETNHLRGYFQIILCAEHKGSRSEKIQQVMDLAGSQAEDTYMVGDAVSDIDAAHAAGIRSIAVSWGHQSKRKLSQVGPDLIVEEPGGLLQYFLG